MRQIGISPPRVDGHAKVTGQARFVDDLRWPDMWFGATKRSPHAHARIVSVRFDADRAPAGAACVTWTDIPAHNGVQMLDDSWPVLASDAVQHVGEPVALVAAPTRDAALAALEAVVVEYEPLTPVLDWKDAETAEPLSALDLTQGDAARAMAAAEFVVEGLYYTGHQEHIYIECQGVLARWSDDEHVVIHGSMQCPYYVNKALAHTLGIPAANVRVVAELMGGAFGGKEEFPSLLAAHAALLARRTGKAIKMIYDRHEDIVATTKRHPSRSRVRSGVNRRGELQAVEIDLDLDGGAYRGLSPVVLSRAVLHATGAYRCPNVSIRGRVLKTNTTPNGAFRGFGAPQAQFAAERQMDRIARCLGLDPLTVRRRNVLRPGDRLPTGQVLDDSAAAHLVLETVAELTHFQRRWEDLEELNAQGLDGETRRGLGLSLYFHGAGFTGMGEARMRSPVTVRLAADGKLEVLTASTEMGQGAFTVLTLIAAEAAGLLPSDVVVAVPDTAVVPDSGPTVASRTSMIVGGVAARGARELTRRVLEWAQTARGVGPLELEHGRVVGPEAEMGSFVDLAREYLRAQGPLEVTLRNEPPAWQQFDEKTYQGAAYPTYSWGADVIEVEVDPDTLETRPLRATVVNEVGKVLHEILCRGQVEGGTLQAIGYALYEDMQLRDGHYLNDRLATYIIPTFMDGPDIDVHLLERPWEGEPFGAKGVGELPMDGGAPAVCAAVENATGIVPTRIPATPERLYEWDRSGQRVQGLVALRRTS